MIGLRNIFQRRQGLPSVNEITIGDFLKIAFGLMPEPKNWNEILLFFQENNKGVKSDPLLQLVIEINYLQNKIILIEMCISSAVIFSDEIMSNLSLLLPRYKFTKDSFDSDCKKAIGDVKSMQIKLNEKKTQLDTIKKDQEKIKVSISDWEDVFNSLSKYQGFYFDQNVVTISRFCSIQRAYKQHLKNLETENTLRHGK